MYPKLISFVLGRKNKKIKNWGGGEGWGVNFSFFKVREKIKKKGRKV